MVKFKMMVLCVLVALPLVIGNLFAQEKSTNGIVRGSIIDENGNKINWQKYAGFPKKDAVRSEVSPNEVKLKDGAKVLIKLSNVPEYDWCYGCTATSFAIWMGYYDRYGAPNMYIGPTNGGVAPLTNAGIWDEVSQTDTEQCPIAASKNGIDGRVTRGHGDDYWVRYEDEATDPYYGNWTEHDHTVGTCTADYMGTNQWYNWTNSDGSTTSFYYDAPSGSKIFDPADVLVPDPMRAGIHGMRLLLESIGYSVEQTYYQNITGWVQPGNEAVGPVVGGYEFATYKASIDKGQPVVIGLTGHNVVGYGYDESYDPPRVYIRSTWYNNTGDTEYFSWGGAWNGMDHEQMHVLDLGTECFWSEPRNVFALNNNRQVTVTWDDPSKGTKNVSYQVFRDDLQIGTSTTESYIDNGASDGVHYYSVKAVYEDENPVVTSVMSDKAAVYVSISVTSFYDNFENTWAAQWLFDPAAGQTGAWGRDTQYVPVGGGTYSLSDSPGANYVDETMLYANGGSVAEVAPGLNFTNAPDASCTFQLRYNYELAFDYLYFQACSDGLNWETLKTWNHENVDVFNAESISLGLFAGESNVRFRFLMYSDQGTNAAGCNIDNFSIAPLAADGTAPYVYYSKEKDYYSAYPNGFEISAYVFEYTGIDYVNVLYKVNGGSEITLSPSSVVGSTYNFIFPVNVAGSMIEFRFDTKDTCVPANQAYKGPFYFVDGLHQKYDGGIASGISTVTTSTSDGEQHALASRFTSFHDDIAGVVIRGYASETQVSADMLVNVWADDGGLPGAALITPLSFPNPANVNDTYAWGYCDLSSYTAIDDMTGDYYVGFGCGTTPDLGETYWPFTSTGETQEYNYERGFYQYYDGNNGPLVWISLGDWVPHIRLVTTNYEISPPIIDPPPAQEKTLGVSSTDSEVVYVGNSGNYALNYEASIEFDGYLAPASTVHSNDFTTFPGTGYTYTLWSAYNGGARVSTANGTGVLTSPAFDTSALTTNVYLEFDQNFSYRTNSYARVEYYTGSAWVQIYNATASSTEHQRIALPIISANTQIRFTGYTTRVSGLTASWFIDNVTVTADAIPYTWLTLDGGTSTSGFVAEGSTDAITLGYDTDGLTLSQVYTATIRFVDTEGGAFDKFTSVSLTVNGDVPPEAPSPVTTSIVGGNVVLDWPDMSGATSYDIYSSSDPYGVFTLLTNVTVSEYTYTPTVTKMFFNVVSKNSKKESPRTIEVRRSVK